MLAYTENIIVPYVVKMHSTLKLPHSQSALAIFDHFEGQLTSRVQASLDSNDIFAVDVPANCTDRLQPMDLSINKPFKYHMKASFQTWYTQEACLQLKQKQMHKAVDLRMSVVKPLSTNWIMAAFIYVQNNSELVKNGFREAGISAALS